MPIFAITISQMRDWEAQTWATGQSEAAVIEKVGVKVAEVALRLTRPGDTILILAGKGNNGKDALAARPHLEDRQVEILHLENPASHFERLRTLLGGVSNEHTTTPAPSPALVIDGLFGIGLNRTLSPDWIRVINLVNQAKRRVLAIDVPSGLNGDSGEPEGGAAIEAGLTLTVGAPKRGLLKSVASQFVGRLEVATDVGLLPRAPESEIEWITASDFRTFPPARPVDSHKGTFGHLGIIAGSKGFHGAAVLCARGAQKAKPGLITLAASESVYFPVAAQLQAVMVTSWDRNVVSSYDWDAVVAGPGLAGAEVPDDLKRYVADLWRESDKPVVVDASALNWLETGAITGSGLRVLTPHPGEAARMLGTTTAAVQSDRFAALRGLSTRFGNAWVVLKGHHTLVGRGTGPIQVNSSGNPGLAQGGSGDVLAGLIGGYLAQSELAEVAERTLAYAVWAHGAAADALEEKQYGWTIENLLDSIGGSRQAFEAR
jgi:ADP-dependent NAD(P)H-hydrate dehydratase / NAD(P)H-hydrate epimerase